MHNLIRTLDFQRLSGTRRILGIDLTEKRLRVVEIEKSGSVFNRYKVKFHVRDSFLCKFDVLSSVEMRAKLLTDWLDGKKDRTRLAVATVQSRAVKIVQATIPRGVEDTVEWMNDHSKKLLNIPIALSELAWQFESIASTEAGELVEVTFVRNSEIDELKRFLSLCGITLIALSAGERDSFSCALLEQSFGQADSCQYVSVSDGRAQVGEFRAQRYCGSKVVAQATLKSLFQSTPAGQDVGAASISSKQIFVSGDSVGEDPDLPEGSRVCRPLGLEPGDALAVGLAVKGFLPDISPVNFLSRAEQERNSIQRYKSLLRRMIVCAGTTLIVLLAIPMAISARLESPKEILDEKLLTLDGSLREIQRLKGQVSSLELRYERESSFGQRTNVAKILHDLASATPAKLWLTKMTVTRAANQKSSFRVNGLATASEFVSAYVKSLSGSSRDVSLIYLGLPKNRGGPASFYTQVHSATMFEFEIAVSLQ